MEMRLTVAGPGTAAQDVVVECQPGASVGDLAAAVADFLRIDAGPNGVLVFSERKNTIVERSRPVAQAGLADGDRVRVEPAEALDADRAVVVLRVDGGPAKGAVHLLAAGSHTLGRSPDVNVQFKDDSVSRLHATLDLTPSTWTITDHRSNNGTVVDGRLIDAPARLREGSRVELGTSTFAVEPGPAARNGAPRADLTIHLDPAGRLAFNRPPRLQAAYLPTVIDLPAPPSEPSKRSFPIGTALIPLVMGLALFIVTKSPTMLLFAAAAPAMGAYSVWDDRRSGRRSFTTSAATFRASVGDAAARLHDLLEQERTVLAAEAPGPDELERRAVGRTPDLWERRPGDGDFLTVRVGTGEGAARTTVRVLAGGSAALQEEAAAQLAPAARVSDVPVTVSLADAAVVGVAGPAAGDLVRWLVAQVAVLHSPRDVVIVAAASEAAAEQWTWLPWLPHVDDTKVPGLSSAVARNENEAKLLVEHVRQVVVERRGRPGPHLPSIVVVWDGGLRVDRSVVGPLLSAADTGVHVVWREEHLGDLPGECGTVVIAGPDGRAELRGVGAGIIHAGVTADALTSDRADTLARALAPIRDVSAASSTASVPRRVGLLEVLGLTHVDGAAIATRWREAATGVGATIGMTADGPFELDLRTDGPHMLVGGITNAGKSELLQAFVASMAATHPPDRVSFLLVDYKGTSAFGVAENMPHTVGLVSDLRPHLTKRALVSLNAELRRREAVLSRAGLKDLPALEARDPANCPPNLLVVIDEFAALAKEVPEFVDGVVDVAQRGRSLGLHLVLATQRPSDAINDKIRANVDLRIALRVADADLSSQIIGSPRAAQIPRDLPGRAVARLGPGTLVEFQAAYGGTRTASDGTARSPVVVRTVGMAPPRPAASGPTDMERIVSAVASATVETGCQLPARPWLPELPELISLDALPPSPDDESCVVGVRDDPRSQLQDPFALELERVGSVGVFGATRSGKTTLLVTIACSLAKVARPGELWLYAIDFASRGLTALEPLPPVGSVLVGDDQERIERLFLELRNTIEARRAAFGAAHVSTLSEFRESSGDRRTFPRIVVILDGVAGFQAAFERVDLGALVEALPRLVTDGGPVGVHFVLASDRRPGGSAALAGLLTERVVLRQADPADYSSFGIDTRGLDPAALPPGRALAVDGSEVQVACVGIDASAGAQALAVAELARELAAQTPWRAPQIRVLDAEVSAAALPAPADAVTPVIGVGGSRLAPLACSLATRHLLVVGPHRSGRTTALGSITQSLTRADTPPQLVLFAPRRSSLADLRAWDSVAIGPACTDAFEALRIELDARPDDGSAAWLIVVIDDAENLDDVVRADAAERFARRARDTNVRLVVASETRAAHRAFNGVIAEVRKDKQGLLLQPEPDVDGDILGVRLPRRSRPVRVPGRGYLVTTEGADLVQVAVAETVD